MRVPRDLQELAIRIRRVSDDLASDLGREPTAAELAAQLGVSLEQVLDAREALDAHHAVSLDVPLGDGRRTTAIRSAPSSGIEEAGFENGGRLRPRSRV